MNGNEYHIYAYVGSRRDIFFDKSPMALREYLRSVNIGNTVSVEPSRVAKLLLGERGGNNSHLSIYRSVRLVALFKRGFNKEFYCVAACRHCLWNIYLYPYYHVVARKRRVVSLKLKRDENVGEISRRGEQIILVGYKLARGNVNDDLLDAIETDIVLERRLYPYPSRLFSYSLSAYNYLIGKSLPLKNRV